MRLTRTWWTVVALVAVVSVAGAFVGLRCSAAQTANSPAWAALIPVALSDADATQLRAAAERYYAVVSGPNPGDVAPLLAEPLEQLARIAQMWDPVHQRVLAVAWMGDPFIVSPGVAAIRAAVTRRFLDGQNEGKTWGRVESLYFRLSDPDRLVWLDGLSVAGMHFGPTKPVDWFAPNLVNRRFKDFTPDMRPAILALFSTKWPGWSDNADEFWPHLVEWVAAQTTAYGPPAKSETTDFRFCAKYVEAWGDDVVAERQFRYEKADGLDTLVTYRFLMTHEKSLPYDPPNRQKPGNDWRIADACAVKVETVKATTPPMPPSCSGPQGQ